MGEANLGQLQTSEFLLSLAPRWSKRNQKACLLWWLRLPSAIKVQHAASTCWFYLHQTVAVTQTAQTTDDCQETNGAVQTTAPPMGTSSAWAWSHWCCKPSDGDWIWMQVGQTYISDCNCILSCTTSSNTIFNFRSRMFLKTEWQIPWLKLKGSTLVALKPSFPGVRIDAIQYIGHVDM